MSISRVECHVKNCLAINHRKSVLLPEEGEYVNFQKFKRLKNAPFIIYGDSEFVLILSTDNNNLGPNNKKYYYHFVCSYGYKLIFVEERQQTIHNLIWWRCYWQIYEWFDKRKWILF